MLKFIDSYTKVDFSRLERRNVPSVSIYMPTHRGSNKKNQDRLVYKNLLLEAEKSLTRFEDKNDYKEIVANLTALLDDLSEEIWRNSKESLAVLADAEDTYVFLLEYPVEERVIVSSSFHIKPLIREYQYGARYYALTLSKDIFNVYQGDFYSLHKMELPTGVENEFKKLFPIEDDDSNVNIASYAGLQGHRHGHRATSEVSEKEAQKFFHYVSNEVEKFLAEEKDMPLVLVGQAQHLAEFKKMTSSLTVLEEGVEKGIESLTPEELFQDVREIVMREQDRHIARLVDAYQKEQAMERASADFRTIANALVERKVEALFIEEDMTILGNFDLGSGEVHIGNDDHDADDITDDFAQLTYAQGGLVYVLPPERMPSDTGVAALFRY